MQIPARKKLWQYPRVRFAAALLLGAVLVMLLAYILSGGSAEPAVAQRSLPGMECLPLYESLLREGSPGRPGTERAIEYVVIHETANRDAGADAATTPNSSRGAGADPPPGTTRWTTPAFTATSRTMRSPGTRGTGRPPTAATCAASGVELCVNSDGDFEKAFDNGARLTAACSASTPSPSPLYASTRISLRRTVPRQFGTRGAGQEFLDRTEQYLDKLS